MFARAPGQNLHSSRRAKLLRLVRKINNRGEPKKEILWKALPERGEENEKENGNSMKEANPVKKLCSVCMIEITESKKSSRGRPALKYCGSQCVEIAMNERTARRNLRRNKSMVTA